MCMCGIIQRGCRTVREARAAEVEREHGDVGAEQRAQHLAAVALTAAVAVQVHHTRQLRLRRVAWSVVPALQLQALGVGHLYQSPPGPGLVSSTGPLPPASTLCADAFDIYGLLRATLIKPRGRKQPIPQSAPIASV